MGLIQKYVRPKAVNKYAEDVKALAAAGEDAAFDIIAPTKAAEGSRGSIATEHAKFQEAARDAGFTARQVESVDNEDGTTRRVYILTDKRSHTAADESAQDAPAEVAKK